MKRSLLLFCGLAILPLCGCSVIAEKAAEVAVKRLGGTSVRATKSVDAAYVAALTPAKSGPGLVVCEPVAVAALKSQSAWGAGASRWLQVQVGGLPELGQTPLWGVIDDGRRQLKLPDLQLNAAAADKLGRACGVTHVAVGTLSGTPANAVLSYQVRDVAAGKVVGRAQIRGSLAQLNSQLPTLAKNLAATLGVKGGTATQIALSPDEVKFLGTPPLKPNFRRTITAAQQARLKTLVSKDVLAGVMAQRWCEYPNGKEWQNVADTMTKMAPRNALVWGEVAFTGPIRVVTLAPKLKSMQAKFPNNYLLCKAGVELERGNTQRPLEVQWAERAVRAAPGSCYAWCDLEDALGNAAQSLRRSRYSNQISGAQWQTLDGFYQKSRAAALQATKVNPDNSFAWTAVAEAETFGGDQTQAEAALEKALKLDPANGKAWNWGMQMTQPKWSGDGQKFLAFAARAAGHADVFYFPAEDVSHVYQDLNQRPQFKTVLQTVVAKDPRNVEALTELGAIYHYDDRSYKKAETLYRAALKINPAYGRALSSLGDLTYWVHNDPAGAFTLYRAAIAADPRDGYFHANLGRMLALTGRKSSGAAEANLAKKLGFSDRSHPVWEATGVAPPSNF